MSNRRWISIAILLIAIAVLGAVIVVWQVQNREAYQHAKTSIENRQMEVVATTRATVQPSLPTSTIYPSVTPFEITPLAGQPTLILPTKVSP